MNRRAALITIGLTAFGSVAWSLTRPGLLQGKAHNSLAASPPPSNQALDDRLRDDIAHRSQRINSEEGIAMFLVCENLVPQTAKPALTPMNVTLASALHRNAEAWLRIRPDAQSKDVAELIEVLADRDFTHGGTGEGQ